MPFKRSYSPVLDDASYTAIEGNGSKVMLRFEAGEYTTPFWIEVENGPVIRVDELPFQTVLEVPA